MVKGVKKMSNNDEGCSRQGGGCQPQGFSAEELAQYDYWRGINDIKVYLFHIYIGFFSGICIGFCIFGIRIGFCIFGEIMRDFSVGVIFALVLVGILGLGCWCTQFKMPRIIKMVLCLSSCMAILLWSWCLIRALLSPAEDTIAVVVMACATALFLLHMLLPLFAIWERWKFRRLSRQQYEKKMKRFRSGLSIKIDAFLRRHPSLCFADDKEKIFNISGFFYLLLLPLIYIFGVRIIELGDWTIPDEAELRIEKHIVPDKDNMYTALMAITNLYHVGEDGGGDENCDVSDHDFVQSYGDLDDANKTNSLPSRQRARKILSDNADFFPAFHAAVARQGFAVTDSEDEQSYWHEFFNMACLVSMKAQTALEDGNMDAALADIKDIHSLGEIWSAENEGAFGYIFGYIFGLRVKLESYEKMRNAVAMGVANDKAIMEFIKMIDADDAAASANRERAIKGNWEYYSCMENLYSEPKNVCLSNLIDHIACRLRHPPRQTKFRVAEIIRAQLVDENNDISFAKNRSARTDFSWFIPGSGCSACIGSSIEKRSTCSEWFIRDRFERLRIRLIVASEKWRRAHNGRNPETLDALVPEYISSVPVDPWDEARGKVKYDAAHGVVWSIGDKGEYDYLKAAAERKKDGSAQAQDDDTRKYAFRLDGRSK